MLFNNQFDGCMNLPPVEVSMGISAKHLVEYSMIVVVWDLQVMYSMTSPLGFMNWLSFNRNIPLAGL